MRQTHCPSDYLRVARAKAHLRKPPSLSARSPKVLLIDDDETTRRDVGEFLSTKGFGVAHASDGKVALEVLRGGLVPDVILLDLIMPGMDGAQLHAELKANPIWSEIPVVLITAVPDAHPAGVEAVLAKPFEFDALMASMQELCPPDLPVRRVMVVEDERDVRESTRDLLEATGYTVTMAEDGQQALELLTAGAVPDLIVTDLMMPRLNGVELVRRLRSVPELALIPVIVVSGATGSIENGLAVDAIVTKPIDTEKLLTFVGKLRSKPARRRATRNARSTPATTATPALDSRDSRTGRVRFFAAVAHELRGPLQSILSSQQLMQRSPALGQKEQSQLEVMSRGTRKLARLVEDLLDFLKVDATGFFNVKVASCDMHQVCAHAIQELATANPECEIRLSATGALVGHFDEVRIAQVVTNLVQNAIKYGAPGSPVTVTLSEADDAVVLQVTNHGPPIPEAALVTLFDPFKRAVPQNDARPGLGLGLAIVRQIAFAHGGAVDVESNESRTTFSVVLPKFTPARQSA